MTENNQTEELTEQDVFLTRTLDAPRELVWKAFSEAERLAQWWGPKGCNVRVEKLDFRPGGMFHYAMQTPDGGEMWGRLSYREIVAPERVTFVVSFADADANIVRAPFSSTWPLELLARNTFTEQDGKTTLTMAAKPINETEEERQSFEKGRASLRQGTEASMDQLAEYLKSQTS